jgi:hypothetical protein
MKSLKMKLALSAVAIAMLATPALAQRVRHHALSQQTQSQDYTGDQAAQQPLHYPNGATRSGSEESFESGAEFNLGN